MNDWLENFKDTIETAAPRLLQVSEAQTSSHDPKSIGLQNRSLAT